MAKINFNLRNPKSGLTPTPINCVIRYNNIKLVYPTGITIPPKFWDSENQRVEDTKKYPTHPETNESLTRLETLILKVFRNFENDNGYQPTANELRDRLNIATNKVEKVKPTDLFTFIAKFREESKTKINKDTKKLFAEKTLLNYKQLNDILLEFNSKRKKPLNFDDIDLEFYNDFTAFLTTEKSFSVNSIGKHIKTLKTILNEALERGLTTNLKFKSKKFAVLTMQTDSVYLTYEELKLIQDLDLSKNAKLEKVRDLFLIGCFTGLRFSDFTNIKPENIKDDLLTIETKKTGQIVSIPIHEAIKPIFQKYMNRDNSPLPRTLSNQKMNEYIKVICKQVKPLNEFVSIKENKGGLTYFTKYQKFELITTHTARRSFATNNFKSGLSSQVIMAITGHKTEKSFLTYIKVTPSENAEIMRLHWANLANLKVS